MAVLASGIKQLTLLGIQSIETKLRRKLAKTTQCLYERTWHLDMHFKVFEMVLDTTTYNTGANNGARFLLQKMLNRNFYGFLLSPHLWGVMSGIL